MDVNASGRPSPHHTNLQRQRGNAQQPRTNPHKPSVPHPSVFSSRFLPTPYERNRRLHKVCPNSWINLRTWPRSVYELRKTKGRGLRGGVMGGAGVRGGAGTCTRLPGYGGIPAPARPRRPVVRQSRVLGLALAPPPSSSCRSLPTSAHLTR